MNGKEGSAALTGGISILFVPTDFREDEVLLHEERKSGKKIHATTSSFLYLAFILFQITLSKIINNKLAYWISLALFYAPYVRKDVVLNYNLKGRKIE